MTRDGEENRMMIEEHKEDVAAVRRKLEDLRGYL
jgi:hypothetical protein